jgi:hypothetical protein
LIRGDTAYPRDVCLINAQRIRERCRLAAQQRLACVLHALCKVGAMMLDVLVDRALDQL